MKTSMGIYSVLAIILALGVLILIVVNTLTDKKEEQKVVYVVVKSADPDIEFWQTVKMGAIIAAAEEDVSIVFTGPFYETDVKGQIDIVENIIEKKPMAIVLAPTDFKELAPIGEKIVEKGITMVTIDSAIDTQMAHSFIATNNIEAAREAGKAMARLLNGTGKVGLIGHVEGASTAIERLEGFREALEEYDGIEIIEEIWYSDGNVDKAYENTNEMLAKYPDVDGIFGSNEGTVMGIARALDDIGLGGKTILVGFDGSREEVHFIERGVLHAIMVQRPFNMGYLGVKEAVEIARGGKKPENIDTGAVLITKDNLYSPENQKLLFPFVDR